MTPRLLKNDATTFDRLGGGPLNHTIKCEVTENLGQAPELEMEMLADDPNLNNISIGSIIAAAPNKNDLVQGFVVEEMTKPINGVVKIYAVHIAQHRGKLIPVSPFSAADLDGALAAMISNSVEANPFTLVRDPGKNNVTATMAPTVPHSFRELMGGVEGSIIDTYRGEWKYDNLTLTLYNRRGRDNGVRVMYGSNMSDFELEESFSWNGSATGVVGYWSDDEGTVVIGDPQYSALADLFPYKKTVVVDFSDKWDSAPTKSALETYALSWVNGKGGTGVTCEVAFDVLSVNGAEDIGLGDTIHIFNGQYNFDAESRIVGMTYDVLAEQYTKVTIGDLKTTINQAISETSGGSSGSSGGGGSSVEPTTSTPLMDGTAAVGTEQKYARGDHIHPSDTSRVDKTGDTMTGNLSIKGTSITLSSAAGTATQYSPYVGYPDTEDVLMASARVLRTTADVVQYRIGSQRKINNSWIYNNLSIGIAADGTRSIAVTEPKVWRKTIGPAVGDVICTSTNTNPSANYGGTWELIDREFSPMSYNSSDTGAVDPSTYFTKTTQMTALNNLAWKRSGHEIWIRIRFTIANALGTTDRNYGQFILTALGMTSNTGGWYASWFTGYADDQGIFGCQISDNGNLTATVGIARASNYNIPASTELRLTVNQKIGPTFMAASACDKFYWKRTA